MVMDYTALYLASITDPENFWSEQANKFISWDHSWDRVSDYDFVKGKINWYTNAKLNVCKNCVDRHAAAEPQRQALIWQGNNPTETKQYTYKDLLEHVCKTANVLKELGVKKGDRVCIYMPMIPEAVFTMLACARIGAVHSVVFAGFSPESLRTRIIDCGSQIVVTADQGLRGEKIIPLKEHVDTAIAELPQVKSVLLIRRTGVQVPFNKQRDHDYYMLIDKVNPNCEYAIMDASDPLFILYTSGSTGKPKGVVHSSGGYITYASYSFHYVFDYKPQEIFWCTADVGWITGHTYLVYGPLAVGATILLYEGIPTYPDPSRLWNIVDQFKVNIFYTAPTLIRALMAHGDRFLKTTSRESLRVLGSVGEPINPAAWDWYYHQVGQGRCPIVDTWWQTETGGILLSPIPNVTKLKPGSATTPLFGIEPAILDAEGKEISGAGEGYLVFKTSWPGQMQTIFNDPKRFIETYFSKFPGYYVSGDAARRDADGYYWITGRTDDVLNVSGHRIGTAEVESALVKHPMVAEAAVVGCKDPISGEAIYAFVQLMDDAQQNELLQTELAAMVRQEIGGFAVPKKMQFTPELPKTRSGKIMRRILRKIANGDTDDLGDMSTLANQEVVGNLLKHRQND